jgi:hypothetical protein
MTSRPWPTRRATPRQAGFISWCDGWSLAVGVISTTFGRRRRRALRDPRSSSEVGTIRAHSGYRSSRRISDDERLIVIPAEKALTVRWLPR